MDIEHQTRFGDIAKLVSQEYIGDLKKCAKIVSGDNSFLWYKERDYSCLNATALYNISNFSLQTEPIIIQHFNLSFDKTVTNVNYEREFKEHFTIVIFPNGYKRRNSGYVSIMFEGYLGDSGIVALDLHAIFSVNDAVGNQRFSQSVGFNFKYGDVDEESAFVFGIERFLERERLLGSDDLLANDKLAIHFSLQYSSFNPDFERATKFQFVRDVIEVQLPKLFREYFDYEKGKIIYRMQVITGSNYPWDKLRENSPYFQKLFVKAVEEGTKELMPIDREEYLALNNMICFFYYEDVIHVKPEEMCDLFVVADRYDVQRLKEACSDYFIRKMTTEDAAALFALADLHNDLNLKYRSKKFIVDHWPEVIYTDSWLSLQNKTDLAEEVVELIFKTFIVW